MSADLAAGRLRLGIQRFISTYPLFGGMVAAWDHVAGETTTMAIGFSGMSFRLYYNEEFVMEITLDELVGVLHHEARHVVFGHPLLKHSEFPDDDALLIATEVTVNEGIPEPLPGTPITLALFPKLPPDETTIQRYQRLAKPNAGEKVRAISKGADPEDASRSDGEGDSNGEGESEGEGEGEGDAPDDCECPQGQGGHCDSKPKIRPSRRAGGRSVDDHGHWNEILQSQEIAQASLQSTIARVISTLDTLSTYEKSCLGRSAGRGLDPGKGETLLQGTGEEARVPWQQVLRSYVGQVLQRDYTYLRAPRRLQHLLGVVPGTRRRACRPLVQAVIDTSGSISDQDLEDIVAELKVLGRVYEVLVVECDVAIERFYRFTGHIRTIAGRGGTSFLLPLEPAFLRKTRADVVVFFTDLDGEFPRVPPQVPVIWVVMPGCEVTAPWGRTVRMGKNPP